MGFWRLLCYFLLLAWGGQAGNQSKVGAIKCCEERMASANVYCNIPFCFFMTKFQTPLIFLGGANQSISNQNLNQMDSREILPIFQKLLEDKQSSRKNSEIGGGSSTMGRSHESSRASSRFNAARSCPDMSVRCDIIEYL